MWFVGTIEFTSLRTLQDKFTKSCVNSKSELTYISRSLIPGSKKYNKKIVYHKQVCIYAFNKKQLKNFIV